MSLSIVDVAFSDVSKMKKRENVRILFITLVFKMREIIVQECGSFDSARFATNSVLRELKSWNMKIEEAIIPS